MCDRVAHDPNVLSAGATLRGPRILVTGAGIAMLDA